MTDALFPMSEAPRDGRIIRAQKKNGKWVNIRWAARKLDGRGAWCARLEGRPILHEDRWAGWLPLPADDSSAEVASTAAKWLSRCSDEDVADVVRELLRRDGVSRLHTGYLIDAMNEEIACKEEK